MGFHDKIKQYELQKQSRILITQCAAGVGGKYIARHAIFTTDISIVDILPKLRIKDKAWVAERHTYTAHRCSVA